MKTTWNQLSRPLRLAVTTPWCLLAALAGIASTPATRSLLLDAANKPTADVSLASPHWTGTLADERLSSDVPLLSGNYLLLPGPLNVSGYVSFDQNLSRSDGNGTLELGSSLVIGASSSNPSISTPSGAFWQDDGAGGWIGPSWRITGDGSVSNANGYGINGGGHADVSSIRWPDSDIAIEADSQGGHLQCQGGASLGWGQDGVGIPGNLFVGQTLYAESDASVEGNAYFSQTAYVGGAATFAGPVWFHGGISASNLQTTAVGLSSGDFWRDASAGNVVKAVP